MNNDELPMRAETASAYVDRELDAAERSAADADPETMAMADSFVRIRAALADIAPVADVIRSAAIAAALAEFDARDAATPAAAVAVAPVTALKARRVRTYRVLTGVAAALVVGVVAVAALNSPGDDTETFSATEVSVPDDAAATESAEQPTLKVADTGAAAGQPAAGSAADSAAAIVPAVDSQEALEQYADNSEVGGSSSAAPPATTTAAAAVAVTAAPAATEAAPVLPAAAPAVASYQTPSCLPPNDTVLGAITVRGTPALAVRDASTGVVQAIDATDCTVYFSVDGP
jgi:hypothetical protein